ncbi:MAG TPA: extracellular solute-binding protein [Gaiellaceae bacterium]|jgi:ABC-type glycerol-3-phosphate transport system substrate-binding protein|nr:extracellular solute-binding protein [Gaiellaceae bacterium]
MKSNIRAMKSIRIGAALAAVSLLAVAAGSASLAATSASPTVTISVASLIPGSTKAATQEFAAQVAEFQKANPTIKVNSVQYQWTGPTFAAKLAAGTLPTVFTVPFTDARSLGDNGQLADLSTAAKSLPYFNRFNPAVIAEGTDAKGQVVALPTAAYAQALHYNRKLFSEAGLNPNKPPKTWAQVEADAKIISQKTGMAGYAEMGKDDNTAGWILTTLVYSLGGRMETGIGTKAVATLDNPYTVHALNMLKTMRWTNDSMGSNFDYGWSDVNQAFAAGQVGMYISGSDVYTNLVQASSIKPSIYGVTTIPLASNKTAGVLGGGTLAAVDPKANPAEIAAAVKWIDFYYEQPLVNEKQAVRNAKTLAASKQPVGVPALPVFDKAQYQLANTWIKPYINVPVAQMTPFTTGIFSQQLIPEPEASTQSIYHSLDAVVEAVLTDQNANISSLLQQASSAAQTAIKAGT